MINDHEKPFLELNFPTEKQSWTNRNVISSDTLTWWAKKEMKTKKSFCLFRSFYISLYFCFTSLFCLFPAMSHSIFLSFFYILLHFPFFILSSPSLSFFLSLLTLSLSLSLSLSFYSLSLSFPLSFYFWNKFRCKTEREEC